VVIDNQTQETLLVPSQKEAAGNASKRKSSTQENDRSNKSKAGRGDGNAENDRPAKRIKVSIVRAGVELDRY